MNDQNYETPMIKDINQQGVASPRGIIVAALVLVGGYTVALVSVFAGGQGVVVVNVGAVKNVVK